MPRGIPVNPPIRNMTMEETTKSKGVASLYLAHPHGGHPGENLDSGGHGHQQGSDHKGDAQNRRHSGGKHMMAEYNHAAGGDAQTGDSHRFIAEKWFTHKNGYDIAYYPQTQQNKNINRRVRIEPEHILVEENLAPQLGVEEAHPHEAFQQHHQKRHGDKLREDQGHGSRAQAMPR